MAPDANIRYYASRAASTSDLLATLGQVVDENVAQVVTNSWSDLEAERVRGERRRLRAGLQAGCAAGSELPLQLRRQRRRAGRTAALKQVDYPPSDPYVISGRRHLDRHRRLRRDLDADRLGHPEVQPVRERQVLDLGRLPLRCRRRVLGAVQPTVVPERRGRQRGPRRPGRLDGRRPQHGHAHRPDADVPGRRALRGVPHRRDEPGLAVARRVLPRLASRSTASGFGLLNPPSTRRRTATITDVQPVKDLGVVRVDYVERVRRLRRAALLGPDVRPGQPDDEEGLGHGHRTRRAEPEAVRRHPVGSLTTP